MSEPGHSKRLKNLDFAYLWYEQEMVQADIFQAQTA